MSKIVNNASAVVETEKRTVETDPASVGARLLKLRLAHGMSQRKLAGLAGVTNGAISTIEQDRVSPSVASLKKILQVFGLSMAEFFADEFEAPERLFYRAHEMPQITEGLVTIRQLGRSMSNRKLQVLHETYQPNGDTGLAMLSHEGEEAGIIVSGNIEITVGTQTRTPGPGRWLLLQQSPASSVPKFGAGGM